MLDTFDALLPASEQTAERVLERVLQSADGDKQSLALAAIRASDTSLSARSRAIVGQMLASSSAAVRSQALGLAATSGDKYLLKLVVDGGWDARPLRSGEQTFERWYGSSAILEATKAGLIDLNDALDRMDLNQYGFAARDLGTSAAIEVAKRVEAAIARALEFAHASDMPEMQMSTPEARGSKPALISLSDPPPSQDIGDQLSRIGIPLIGRLRKARNLAAHAGMILHPSIAGPKQKIISNFIGGAGKEIPKAAGCASPAFRGEARSDGVVDREGASRALSDPAMTWVRIDGDEIAGRIVGSLV